MNNKFSLLLVMAAIIVSGCIEERVELQKPTVTVRDVDVVNATQEVLNLDVHVIVDNPNPVGANLTRIDFDIYYLQDSESNFLGHGEKYDVEIRSEGQTPVTVPVAVNNTQAIQAVSEMAREGAVTIRVNGSAFLDLEVTQFEIPFEITREITPETLRQ